MTVTEPAVPGRRLQLANISVANLPLAEVIPAAAAAGFDCFSILARSHRRAVTREGQTSAGLAAMAADHGIGIQDLEAAGDWLRPVPDNDRPWFHPVYETSQFLDVAAELGAKTLVATHFGERAPVDEAVERFAALCDGASARGVDVALEFPAMATVGDVVAAWEIVRLADRPNAGVLVDNWHHRRSPATDADLLQVPAARILSVQLSDATREPLLPLIDDVGERLLLGDGELDVVGFVRLLDAHGVDCPIGIEVLRREIVADGAGPACARLMASLRAVLLAV